jgi:hypothetical protein
VIDWTKTDEQILAELLEEVSKPTGRLVTFGDLDAELGAEAYQVIVGVFETAQSVNPSLRPAFLALSTTGLTLDSPSRFAMLDQLATAGYGADGSQPWPTQWVTQIKAMAVTVRPRWQIAGLSEKPTLESIALSRSATEANDKWDRVSRVVEDRLISGSITTWDQVREIVMSV